MARNLRLSAKAPKANGSIAAGLGAWTSIEADLVGRAPHGTWAEKLLSEVYARHSQYLAEMDRTSEARSMAERAIRLGTKTGPDRDHLAPAVSALAKTIQGSQAAPKGKIVAMVEAWADQIERPEYKAWLYAEHAICRAGQGARHAALESAQTACELASRCENASELTYRQLDLAKVFLHFKMAEEAIEVLPICETPSQALRFEGAYLHGKARAAMGKLDEAREWSVRIGQLSKSSANPAYVKKSDRFRQDLFLS